MPQFELGQELTIEQRKALVQAVTDAVLMGHAPVQIQDLLEWAKRVIAERIALEMIFQGCIAVGKDKNTGEMRFFITEHGKGVFTQTRMEHDVPQAFRDVFGYDDVAENDV